MAKLFIECTKNGMGPNNKTVRERKKYWIAVGFKRVLPWIHAVTHFCAGGINLLYLRS